MVDSMFYRECQKGMYVGLHKACLPLYSMFKLAEDNIGEDEVTVIVEDKPNLRCTSNITSLVVSGLNISITMQGNLIP